MQNREENSLSIAVLTVSDTRTEDTDTSGQYLTEVLRAAGHRLWEKKIVPDDIYRLRAEVSRWIAEEAVQVVLTTGGTGFSGRDSTPEALAPLFDKHVEGFGELFRSISYDEIGSSTIQSRALAGLANNTLICAVPGSTGACRTAWENILSRQLDASFKPCNFVAHLLPRT
ncbi:molybdenum cofactor biosynthesis protein B [Microbulbifer halophilus]|uniref:Molybdenum cofactor biosynthesis protein B n=1 Tax=Microbulbifer halophilus TaxID=453963 RepID=A0ABW5EBC0_9GAMM|nr:molybdenum cofactor biosynthesis protein B [Microbulbifer halophilus]MCW8125817.1 molybdenum cofactor biosynthesis protein B [Microbulbifer halophilus]